MVDPAGPTAVDFVNDACREHRTAPGTSGSQRVGNRRRRGNHEPATGGVSPGAGRWARTGEAAPVPRRTDGMAGSDCQASLGQARTAAFAPATTTHRTGLHTTAASADRTTTTRATRTTGRRARARRTASRRRRTRARRTASRRRTRARRTAGRRRRTRAHRTAGTRRTAVTRGQRATTTRASGATGTSGVCRGTCTRTCRTIGICRTTGRTQRATCAAGVCRVGRTRRACTTRARRRRTDTCPCGRTRPDGPHQTRPSHTATRSHRAPSARARTGAGRT